ncbi:MAG: hypothetical protein WB809_05665 [Thermoplasmata archaeon]
MVDTGRGHDHPEKTVHVRIDPNDESTTLEDVLTRISELQRKHPDREVFFDGDEYAICSRPKRTRAVASH